MSQTTGRMDVDRRGMLLCTASACLAASLQVGWASAADEAALTVADVTPPVELVQELLKR